MTTPHPPYSRHETSRRDAWSIHALLSRIAGIVGCTLAGILLQTSSSPAQEFHFRHFTVRDGLPSNRITCLLQDSRGFLWAGTNEGLALFDGYSVRSFGVNEGLDATLVVDIAEDHVRQGSLWIATSGGVYHFDGRRFVRLPSRNDHPEFDVSSVLSDHTGRLWCFAEDTLYHDRGDSLVVADPLIVRTGVGQMLESADSLVWLAHAKGTTVVNVRSGALLSVFSSAHFQHGVRRVAKAPDGSVWTYELNEDQTRGGLLHYKGLDCVERREVSGLGRVDFLLARGDRELLLGGFNGVYRIPLAAGALTATRFLSSARGLQENFLRAGLIDREGSLWLGENSHGVSRLTRWGVVRIPMDSVESGHRRSLAAVDAADHIWIAAPEGLWEVGRDAEDQWTRTLHRMLPRPISVWVDSTGLVWLANEKGDVLSYLPTHRTGLPTMLRLQRRLVMGKEIPKAFPVTFIVSRRQELSYSLGDLGLLVLPLKGDVRTMHLFGQKEAPPIIYVQELVEDHLGRLWCGTYQDGVRVIDRSTGNGPGRVSDPLAGKLPERSIRSVLEDRRGRIWIGMRSTGAVVFNGDSVRLWTMADGLPSNTIWSMTEDSAGGIWLGTPAGAARLDLEGAPRVMREPALAGAGVFDCGTFHCGLLWFLTSEGLVVLDPTEEKKGTPPPEVFLTDISFNGSSAPTRQPMELPYTQNTLTASFVTPSYLDESGNVYRFRLLPREDAWQGPTTQQRVTYALLPPGTYTLEVKSQNARGVQSLTAASFSFTITQPFWMRWWFLAGTGLAIVSLLGWSVRAHELRRIRERMSAFERQQSLDRERLRISQDMHDEIGSALTEITMLSELARRAANQAAVQERHLKTIADKSRAVVTSMGEIIWAINPRFAYAEDLFAYLRQYATRFCDTAGLHCSIEIPEGGENIPLSNEQRRNIFLVAKESLRNVVRHSGASRVIVALSLSGSELRMMISDDGRGFIPGSEESFGTGLESMRKRMSDIGGTISINSARGSGASVIISLKCGIAIPPKPV